MTHRYGKSNKIAHALSRKVISLCAIPTEFNSLERIKNWYLDDVGFVKAWRN
jgi:hypothetical protein